MSKSPASAPESAAVAAAAAPAPGVPRLTVLLVVHDRLERLRSCLGCVARQQPAVLAQTEVLVVGDGSPDPSAIVRAAAETLATAATPIVHRVEVRAKAGPAVQRNWGIRAARGELILFLNDDILFDPGFFEAHLAAHDRAPGHSVSGNTRWHPDVVRTPFMHWIAHNDSFYYLCGDHAQIGWEYVHTLNFSAHRRWFDDDPEGGFCEEFPDPAFEDTEWGIRMQKRGMKVAFAPDAIVYHHHYYEPADFWRKTTMKARSARLFLQRHPELRDRILGPRPGRKARLKEHAETAVRRVRGVAEGPREWEARVREIYHREAGSSTA